jgi:hypothetical protein
MVTGPTALYLRPDLREDGERHLCFRLYVWPWQCMAKMDAYAVCESLDMGKRSRFLAQKDSAALQA